MITRNEIYRLTEDARKASLAAHDAWLNSFGPTSNTRSSRLYDEYIKKYKIFNCWRKVLTDIDYNGVDPVVAVLKREL